MFRGSLLGIMTVIALVAGQTGSALHLAAGHRRCPQHGEIIDARVQPVEAAAAPSAGLIIDAASADSEHHDHCPLAGAAAGFTPSPAAHAAAPRVALACLVARRPHMAPGVLLLHVAPKTSPPSPGTSA